VAIHFDALQLPDGATQKIDAAAMSLSFGLSRAMSVGERREPIFSCEPSRVSDSGDIFGGAGGTNGFNGPLSESALLRDRLATNIGIAGDQELNSLAFNQNIVVTVPGNTRFYVVVEKVTASGEGQARPAAIQQANNATLPTGKSSASSCSLGEN